MIYSYRKSDVESPTYKRLYFALNDIFKMINLEDRKLIGVYAIYNDNDQLMYVGKSRNITSRLTTHLRKKYKNAKRISFFEIENEYLDDIEKYLITKYTPIDNIMVDEAYNQKTIDKLLYDYGWDNIELYDQYSIFPQDRFVISDEMELDIHLFINKYAHLKDNNMDFLITQIAEYISTNKEKERVVVLFKKSIEDEISFKEDLKKNPPKKFKFRRKD